MTIKRIILALMLRHFFDWMSDKSFLRLQYWGIFGKLLNLDNPQTFNQKLQWLKLYDHKPEYTDMVDKYSAKLWVTKKIGKQHVIPLLGVWKNAEEIDFDMLPNQFVLKTNHGCGGMVICNDKSKLNINNVRNELNHALKQNYFKFLKEWPYKNVETCILAEEYYIDDSGTGLNDYKFFCFDGEPKAMFIATDRSSETEETKFDFFDMDFNHLPFTNGHPNSKNPIMKPKGFEEMKRLAAILSAGIPHVRVDFYDVDGCVYFGEMTFYHWSGLVPFVPETWDFTFGSWIKLPEKSSLSLENI